MSWLKLDDAFCTHTKTVGLSHRAFRLHVSALCHSAQNLTDGRITVEALKVVGAISGKGKSLTAELVAASLWHPVDDGWQIHGYLDLNPTKSEVQRKRAEAKAAAEARWRPKADANGNAERIASGSAGGNALPPHPIPSLDSPGVLSTRSQPSPQHDGAGADNSRLGRLRKATLVAVGTDDETKLERAMRGVSDADIVDITEKQPANLRDVLGWTLSELKRRKPPQSADRASAAYMTIATMIANGAIYTQETLDDEMHPLDGFLSDEQRDSLREKLLDFNPLAVVGARAETDVA